jgi:NAD+ synthase (glutamine-hydrolysing)
LLVLGSSNADEALRGFYTKYDAASADINPIGSLSKTHLREFLKWCGKKWIELKDTMDKILDTVASPELTPAADNGSIQDDEIEIEMTYNQLYILGKLRKEEMLGPVSMFKRLCEMWLGKTVDLCVKPPDIGELYKDDKVQFVVDGTNIPTPFTKIVQAKATATIIANIVTIFFDFYGIHRNKMTILTPSVHGTGYSPDDNRYDQRPFLYPKFRGSETHKIIVKLAEDMDKKNPLQTGGSRYPKLTRRYKYKNNKYTRNKKH